MNNNHRDKYFNIGILSLAHMLNDLYSNYLPQMLPFLAVINPSFTATQAAILVSAFTVSSSLLQPFFGFLLDRHGKRWLVYAGTIWMAIMLSLTGIVSNYMILVILAALGGLGTAAFHPQASMMINVLGGDRKAVWLSAFVAFGNLGFALGPLLLVPLFQAYGLHATVVTVVPGVIVAILLLFFAPHTPYNNKIFSDTAPVLKEFLRTLKSSAGELIVIVSVIAIRSLAYTGMLTIFPLYFKSQNLSTIAASHMITTMLAAGAIGGVIGGFISDFYGRKRLIVGSLILATPLFFAFFYTQGILSMIFLALAGAALMSSFSVTVVAAQEAIPENKALAAGLTLGFANGLGGLAIIPLGHIGDVWGLSLAVCVTFLLPIFSGLIGLFMKSRPAAYSQYTPSEISGSKVPFRITNKGE